ncbi:MAG TPA: ABC transporter substrate-binding protein [Anaerolineales bacterium]
MKNRIMTLLGLLIAVSMVLAACGPAETATTEPDAPAAPTEVPAAAPDPTAVPEPTAVPRTTRRGGWLDSVTMVAISPDAVVTQLQAGEVDIYASALGRAEDFKSAQAAGLQYKQVFGGYYELTFNPYGGGDNGAVFDASTGALNPFAVPAIREAMNMLVDRDYIVQEIYGGLAAPKFFPINSAFPDYALLADVARKLEAQYAFNPDKAKETIDAEMAALGAEMVDGKWNFNGEPVTLIFIIRNDGDGTRLPIGDYVSNQLENIGFTVDRQYKTSSEASPIWIRGNPADGLWHLYTGGWITTAVSRDDGSNFQFFYTPKGLGQPLWQAYKPAADFDAIGDTLTSNDFSDLAERRDLFAQALELSLKDSVRVWLVDQKAFSPFNQGISVTADLAGGIQGAQLWGFTARYDGQEGGDLTFAMSDLLVEPWNPVAGSNWVYDTAPKRATADYGVINDPYTGLAWPQRIESASVTVKEGLPVGKTLDWVSFEFAPEIQVPADAVADWDADTQSFITVGEKFPEGVTALRKSVVTYPADFFDTYTWHDGSPFSAADFVMYWIMQFDRAKETSPLYDEGYVSTFDFFMSNFKGFRITSTDPFTFEYYSDLYALDAELNITDSWPAYGFGDAPWHMIAMGNRAEAAGELAYSADKADANAVEWMSFIDGPSLEVLGRHLDEAEAESFIPYAATLGQYITAEEAAARYANMKTWFGEHGHYWVNSGPYYLDKVFSVEKTLTIRQNANYIDLADEWAGFATPKVAEAEVDGEGRVTIGQEAVFDVFVTFEGEPYPSGDIAEVKFLLFGANGALAATGLAEAAGDGQYTVTLGADVTSKLEAGSNKLEVVVVSKLVSIPTFAPFEFVTAP